MVMDDKEREWATANPDGCVSNIYHRIVAAMDLLRSGKTIVAYESLDETKEYIWELKKILELKK